MSTTNIQRFLRANYSDEQLAALLAHTESGRLSYNSCCCLVGIPLAPHALRGAHEYDSPRIGSGARDHLSQARKLQYAREAELEFALLGPDEARRQAVLPLIRAEMRRRATPGKPRLGRKENRIVADDAMLETTDEVSLCCA